MRDGTISELWRYPVKSMGGGAVETVALTAQGVVGDRTWACAGIYAGVSGPGRLAVGDPVGLPG